MIEIAGIGLKPELVANAGITTLIGIEVLKKILPAQITGKEPGLALLAPLLVGVAGHFFGVPGLSGSLSELIPGLLGGTVVAKVSHDALAPGMDKVSNVISSLAAMGKKPQ